MDELEDQLIDELYFVISYDDLVRSLPWDNSFTTKLIELIERKWVDQLHFDKTIGDFIKMSEPNTNQLQQYSYLANKKGLLEHSGF